MNLIGGSMAMPYASVEDLPNNVRNTLPAHAQEIFRKAFNNAWEEYGEEETAFKVAWAAVKRKYAKESDGAWRPKG